MRKILSCILLIGVISAITGCTAGTESSTRKSTTKIDLTGESDKPSYFLKVTGDRPFGIAFHKGTGYMVTAPASGNGVLSKVTPDGKVREFAKLEGDFSGDYFTDKSFISSGIDFDKDSNIYITLGDKLLKISRNGEISTIADGFSRCFDVKLDPDGNIYVADDKVDTIYKFTPSMKKSVFYKGQSKDDFVLTSLTFDKNYENLYAREGNKILKFSLKSPKAPSQPEVVAENLKIFDICIDGDNGFYASTGDTSPVKRISLNGQITDVGTPGQIQNSIGLNMGKEGFDTNSLYVTVDDGIIKVPVHN